MTLLGYLKGFLGTGDAHGDKYLSRQADGKGGWTYKYADDGERVSPPNKLTTAHDHVANALLQMGEKKASTISVHVASQDDRRPESEAGKYHVVTVRHAGVDNGDKWVGSPYGIMHSTFGGRPAYEHRDAHDAFSKQINASHKQHGKAPKAKRLKRSED